ncbi:hypothetical protein Kpol_206p3 [Vanderwaltozyma polyspora DSM 70294]|uniref:GOLD domain-containing protein n=1 Tax=Vanderwaltozyma polyspora (strain ATCC 22028 / DSM 70294 / BCRC 21397 / CBS 2163 / NBRC 10782 / NRRL Y-8283 / UCD 57-17) TaxID=436907 RepID=A7TTH2_VANPO|nr:uncharacterized protein Kpol_206p3 [Vanderwaltozyma polyspora DSM 70294]EDO14435.1 hypothetical protein Kpol_206p3 [Vanderwaltozyma polyspora DSM 70294]
MLSSIFFTFFLFVCHVLAGTNHVPIVISLPAHGSECLYQDLSNPDDTINVSYQVLTGGNFEIDFKITAPDQSILVSEQQKKYSDFALKSFGLGQYTFCFHNNYGSDLKKVEITLELDKEIITTDDDDDTKDAVANNAIEEIDRSLNKMTKALNYLRAREWRNMSTVESTEFRLTWLSLLVMAVMIGISVGQAFIIQFFFKSNRKNYV